MYDLYMGDDPVYDIAKLLDTKRPLIRAVNAAWAAFLQMPERETRGSVLATTVAYISACSRANWCAA
ncbi:hypothetical protein CR162_18485 [Pseudoroseomonas rhizosphaerae]|uniref:Uncharacterized protein n=1 Tax=Teichococcus rhizosphaerae TaxID=1335062 RepID=A0A2C6XY47_9PROT|nr:hypothetical protein [Pseudoroseomonas rhizosphaerae]PHK93462.1 hypothetical protein CR162_18485 [Pseudoroseomonas rhizosphaerae]